MCVAVYARTSGPDEVSCNHSKERESNTIKANYTSQMSFTQFVESVEDFIFGPVTETRVGPWGDKRLEDRLQKILFGWAPVSDWVGEEHHYHRDNGSELYVTYSQDGIQQIRVTTTRGKMKAIDAAIVLVNEAEQGGYQRGTTVFTIPGQDDYDEETDAQIREYDNTREHHGHNAPSPGDNVPHYKEKKFKTVF